MAWVRILTNEFDKDNAAQSYMCSITDTKELLQSKNTGSTLQVVDASDTVTEVWTWYIDKWVKV